MTRLALGAKPNNGNTRQNQHSGAQVRLALTGFFAIGKIFFNCPKHRVLPLQIGRFVTYSLYVYFHGGDYVPIVIAVMVLKNNGRQAVSEETTWYIIIVYAR